MVVTQAPAAVTESPPRRSRVARPWVAVLVGVASLGAFVVIQLIVQRWATSGLVRGSGEAAPHFDLVWPIIRYQLAGDVSRYLGLAVAGLVLVWSGRRRWFWVPAAVYTITPMVLGWGDWSCQLTTRTLAAVGSGWRFATGCDSATAAGIGPVALELGLVLLPPAMALAGTSRKKSSFEYFGAKTPLTWRDGPEPGSHVVAAAVALAGFACWALLWGWRVSGRAPNPFQPHLLLILPLVAFGGLLATYHPRVAWTLPVTGALLASGWLQMMAAQGRTFSTGGWHEVVSSLPSTWPVLVLPLVAASWRPLSRRAETLAERPLASLVALNALNLLDAALTASAVRSQGAVESNPLVRAIGLPAKVLLVGALSLLVYRTRPRLLVWLVLIFAGVMAWHLAGQFASWRL